MGHVSPRPLSQAGSGAHLPRREPGGSGASRAASARSRARLAEFGESLAADFLCRRGARLLGRNLSVGADEIDLLMAWGRLVVAVEVKTRIEDDPQLQFTAAKAARLLRAGRGLPVRPGRYDLVTVRAGRRGVEVRWLPGVC